MTSKSTTLFDVDPAGLAKLLESRGKGFAVVELVSNAWDTNASRVEVELEPAPGKPYAMLTVRDDDPDGFADLRHAYTLFAESRRKADPTTRGRFNLGEKLVIVLCEWCEIASTKGSLRFDSSGRTSSTAGTKGGSIFRGRMRMKRDELTEALDLLSRLIPPDDVEFVVNGRTVDRRVPIKTLTITLPTVLADGDGNLRPTERRTVVRVYRPLPGTTPTIYELGVPVVETGDAFDVDVAQTVPLNMERDNVTPGYLRRLRTALLNETYDLIDDEQATATWVGAALEDRDVDPAAVASVVTARYGDRAVIYDPSDPEGTKIAVSKGYTVIPPGAFSKDQWRNVKDSGVVKPAGQVTPSPTALLNRDGDGPAWRMLDRADWSENVVRVADYAVVLGELLLGFAPGIRVANDPMVPAAATWGGRTLTFNRGRLGERWFAEIGPSTDELLLHEFAHDRVSDHLSARFADEVARLGALLVEAALISPEHFAAWRKAPVSS